MKMIILISAILSLYTTNSISEEWEELTQFTDNNFNNQNFDFFIFRETTFDSMFLAWEQVANDSTTQIVYENLVEDSGPKIVLSQPGIHFKNPKFYPDYNNYKQTLAITFTLLYETNQNGNVDIYSINYLGNGSFSEPIPFYTSSNDDKNVCVGREKIVWESDGKIYCSEFDTSPEIITEKDCSSPSISNSDWVITWLKMENDSLRIYYTEWDVYNEEWQSNNVLFYSGTSEHNSFNNGDGGDFLSWQNISDTISQIYFCDYNYDINTYTLDQYTYLNKYEPSTFWLAIPSKTTNQFYPLTAFVLDTSEYHHIYANDNFMGSENFAQLSTDYTMNRNPQIFSGSRNYENDALLIWESFDNIHWQLQMRKISFILSDINEKYNSKPSQFEVYQNYPNPFNPFTTISFRLPKQSQVEIIIYNSVGEEVKRLYSDEMNRGKHSVTFDGSEYSSGLYFYKILAGKYNLVKKCLLIK